MDQAHGSCGGPWAAAESGLTGTLVGEFLTRVGEKRERAGREAVAGVGGVLLRPMVSKRTEEGELMRRHFGVGGKAAQMMLCSSPCTHGRAAHDMTTRPNRKAEAAQRRDEGGGCRVGRLRWNWAQRPL
jgi:hypothetical protein